jgi:archaellum component FlaC
MEDAREIAVLAPDLSQGGDGSQSGTLHGKIIPLEEEKDEHENEGKSDDVEEIQEDVEGIEKDVDEIQEDVEEIQENVEDIGEGVEDINEDSSDDVRYRRIEETLQLLSREINELRPSAHQKEIKK